jgi:hypothetical protein
VLTIVSALLIYGGSFSFPTAMALLLGFFLGTFIWGAVYTIRPDLIVSFSWFAGLVALQSAKNKNWSEWRLFLGAALSVLAACMHYWGIAALFGIVWFGLVLIYERRSSPQTLIRPIAAMAAGALVIGAPYLVLFVIPRLPDILAMVSEVQSPGGRTAGFVQAYQRHMESYGGLAQKLFFVPPVRWLTSVLAAPVLDWRIPAVFVGAPLLALWRDARMIAIAGAALPLFVLLYSQGKQVGYTGYLMPEMILYFAGLLLVAIRLPALLLRTSARRTVQTLSAIPVVALALGQVPTSMGSQFDWTSDLDLLDVSRGAAISVVGPDAVVGATSAGTWYKSGAKYLWRANNEIVSITKAGLDVAKYINAVDALVMDSTWFNAYYAPIGSWYVDGMVNLKGFVLPNTPMTIWNFEIFVKPGESRVTGYFIGKDEVTRFTQDESGGATFAVLSCPVAVDLSAVSETFYKMSFPYTARPEATAPHLVLMGFLTVRNAPQGLVKASGCAVRDTVRGTLTKVSRADLLRAGSAAYEAPMTIYGERDAALRAAGRGSPH